MDDIVKKIEKMTALEIIKLIDELKKSFNIDDSMLTFSGGSGGSQAAAQEDAGAATLFKVVMNNVAADKKTELIKTIKTLLELGLAESKGFVDKAAAGEEVIVKTGFKTKAEADEFCSKLTAGGATATVSAA